MTTSAPSPPHAATPADLVPIARVDLGDAEIDALARVVRSGWIMQGPEVAAFEREFAAAVGAAHAVAVANGTVALELALRALGVGPGDDVLTVSHSFIATANAVVAVGARPVFVDIDPVTYGMAPAALERAITPRARAVLCAHQIGFPCALDGILEIAARAGLPVVEDAACALGSELQMNGRWERIGRPHGALATFSFHPRKVLTTGEGGMITAADEGLATRLRRLRQHAVVPAAGGAAFESYVEPAFNARMTDLQAALGRTQLRRLDAIVAERRAIAARYRAAFAAHPLIVPPDERPWARTNWQSYPLRLRPGVPCTQRAAMERLAAAGVASRRGVHNAHQEPAYAGRNTWACGPAPHGCPPGSCDRLLESERARDEAILIPLFSGLRADEIDRLIAAVGALGTA